MNITLLFDTGSRCKRRLLNISQLTHDFTPLYYNALLSLYVFSRWDTASAFKGIWKSEADKTPSKETTLSGCFKSPKKSWNVSKNLFLQLKKFTCFMHKPKGSHLAVDNLRYEMVLKKCCGKENHLNLKKSTQWSSLPSLEPALENT